MYFYNKFSNNYTKRILKFKKFVRIKCEIILPNLFRNSCQDIKKTRLG